MLLPIAQIRFDSKYVVRDLVQEVVDDYEQALRDGITLPKPHVFYDGEYYWLADGRHRTTAHKQFGSAEVDVEVHNGTELDAYVYGITAQDKNGLRLTHEDKRRIVKDIITDDQLSMKWNDSEVARICHFSLSFVQNVRRSLSKTSQPGTTSEVVPRRELSGATKDEEEVSYTKPTGGRAKRKSPAGKRSQRAKAAATTYDWKNFDKVYKALFVQVDALGVLYNRHNIEMAEQLRSDLDAWKGNFKIYGKFIEEEKEQTCASA